MDKEQCSLRVGEEIRNFLSDEELLQELYAISAMADGLRGFYQPEFNKTRFRNYVERGIQNSITRLSNKVLYRVRKKEDGIDNE